MVKWWHGVAGGVLIAAAIAVAIAVGVWTLARPADRERPDVVLIVIDTLRADHLGVYGYDADTSPRIDAFARENLRFEFAIASAPWTAPSVASIFTGLYPTAHGVARHADVRQAAKGRVEAAVLAEGFQTLAEALKRSGYAAACITANPWVTDYLGFAQGFDSFQSFSDAPAAEINARAFDFLDALERERSPFFLYLHYMDPHTPYRAPAPIPAGPVTRGRYPQSELSLLARYDAEIAYVDAKIGELFDHLRARGLYDDAVVILTSDHGEQFMEQQRRGHGHHLFNPEVHVPLIVKADGRRGEVETTVSLVDIYPTVLQLTKTEPDARLQGVSLFDAASLSRRGVFSEVTRQRNHKAFTSSDGKKLILSYDAQRAALVTRESGVVGLFDSRRDAFEQHPLDDGALLSEMRKGFYALYADSVRRSRRRPARGAQLRKGTAQELRALGYLEDAPNQDSR